MAAAPRRSYSRCMIDFEAHGHVALITIDRPDARNAINGAVASGLEAAVERLEADPDLWIGIVAGNGPVFSAGADLKEIAAGRAASLATERGGFGGITRLPRSKPLIAAVDGPALAGGCELVLTCDLIVASTAASFGIPEVKRSLIAGAGGLFRLPRALPRNIAMELAITGDPISAERAHGLGLVNALCEPGDAIAAALALAARVCVNAPIAVQLSRTLVLAEDVAGDEEAWRITDAATATVMRTEDFAEGPRAFIEKREPVWSGR
jgi:enoyl-CoA hydratase/carnithine racemase